MRVEITKIQILTDQTTGNPLFYCHMADAGHEPALEITLHDTNVRIAGKTLFKVKANPQYKNRVDIYMTIAQARALGQALLTVADTQKRRAPLQSRARPHEARQGRMELPDIIWSRYIKSVLSAAKSESGILMTAHAGYVNIDFEGKHESHIRMGDREIHIGIPLDPPEGRHDPDKAELVEVDPAELQRPRDRAWERNPVSKVDGAVLLLLEPPVAAGLGDLLATFEDDAF